jgi:hypothetical protein
LPNSHTYIHIFLVIGLHISSFLALNAKGEKSIGQSKRTTPPPCFSKKNQTFPNWYFYEKNPLDN